MKIILLGKVIFLFVVVCLLVSCDADKHDKVTKKQPDNAKVAKKNTEVIVAVVNGSTISQLDLDFAITKLVGEEVASRMDKTATRKVLDSMVMSRAISQLQMKEMSPGDNVKIEKELAAYKEQLLVKRYLAEHGSTQPITMQMIKEHYDAHPELFGARSTRKYEMITTKRGLSVAERDELLEKLQNPQKHNNWQEWVKELSVAGYPVDYFQNKDEKGLLHIKLKRALSTLEKNQASSVILINNTPYLMRVTEKLEIPPRPLPEVAEKIRKALAPNQMKLVIEEIGKKALASVDVEYK